jgi:hypothetical protein
VSEREIEYIRVAGTDLPAAVAVCPICKVLDLHTRFDTTQEPWKATCTEGHEWAVRILPPN